MAILTKLPSLSIIAGFKGKLDFYICRGVPVVRKWPQKFQGTPSPARKAQWETFATASRLWSTLSPEVRQYFNAMTGRGGVSGRDLSIKAYISGLYHYDHTPTP